MSNSTSTRRVKSPQQSKRYAALSRKARAQALIAATEPLLSLFAVCDAVFTEDDAMTQHRLVTLGRIYEEWQRCRKALDPDWDKNDRPRRRIAERGRVALPTHAQRITEQEM